MAKKEAASSLLEPSLPLLSEYADGREFAEYAFTKSRYADLIKDLIESYTTDLLILQLKLTLMSN